MCPQAREFQDDSSRAGRRQSHGRERCGPPQNVSLGCGDYFRVIIFKNRMTQEVFLPLPWLPKEFRRRVFLQKRAITNDAGKEYGPGEVGTLAGPGDQSPSVSIVPAGSENTCLPDICFSIYMRITFFLFETPYISPTSSLILSWR